MTTSPASASSNPITILSGGKTTPVAAALAAGDDLWLPLADLTAATGWELKPEGLCRDEVCIPLPADRASELVQGDAGAVRVNLTAFARYAGQPYARDAQHGVWSFGPPSYEWQGRLGSTDAPDFTLPDFAGQPHSLSDYRGKKVFLVTWASW